MESTKTGNIEKMFSKVSPTYDLINHLLSLNFDKGWRQEAARESIAEKKSYRVLDVAAGTGDLSIVIKTLSASMGRKVNIVAYDFSPEMIEIGREKAEKMGLDNLSFVKGDAFNISKELGKFEVVVSGFGLRSFEFSEKRRDGLLAFLKGAFSVMNKGGKIILLDLAMPDGKWDRAFFRIYSKFMLLVGSFVDAETYAWLVSTITRFDKKKLERLMREAGFKNIKTRSLRSGIAFLSTAEK